MTTAPANLLAVRNLLLTHLDNAPGPDDLEPAEVGIVGDPAHRGGYHCGSDRTVTNDYSVFESPRDRAGLTLAASALDVGQFRVTSGGKTHTLATFSIWCVAQCAANAADTRDIREIIYSPDGSTVKRWDRLGKRTTGDSSHRWHTHFSFFRDAIKAGRDQRPLFRRYLQSIGLIPQEEAFLSDAAIAKIDAMYELLTQWRGGVPTMKDGKTVISPVAWRIRDEQGFQPQVLAGLAQLLGKDWVDEQAIVDGVLEGLGTRPEAEVAQALRAAGIDPQRLAEALLALPAA